MNRFQANICLLCVTAIWSSEVIVLSCMPDTVIPFAVSCMTNLIGAALLFMCFFKRIKNEIMKAGKGLVIQCALLAVLYFTYNVLYIYGWKSFDVLTGDFTISMTVIFMPGLMFLLRQKVGVRTLVSSAFITVGVVLAFMGNETSPDIKSLLFVFTAAILRGLFYIKLNRAAKEHDSITLAALIILFSGITSYVGWTALQPATFFAVPWSRQVVASLFVHSYFVTVTAQVLNTFAQRRTTASSATIIYSLENVFAALWCVILPAAIVGSVTMTATKVAAVVFVLLGNLTELIRLPGGVKKNTAQTAGQSSEADSRRDQNPVPEERLRPHFNVMDTTAKQKTLIVLLLFITYFIISIPFKALDIMPGFTDIRPVTILQPIYGIFFGIPGCVVLSLGNVISDIIGGSLRISSAAGALANFLGPFLFYIYWAKYAGTAFDLRSGKRMLKFIGTIIVVAAIEALIITPAVAYFYPDVDYMKFAVIVLCNTILFPVALGIPLTVLIQEEFGFVPVRIQKNYKQPTE